MPSHDVMITVERGPRGGARGWHQRSNVSMTTMRPPLLDADQDTLAVDVVDLEVRHFRHAQARAIGDAECGPILIPGAASSSFATSSTLSTSGNLRGLRVSTSRRDRAGRSSVTVNRKRSADTVLLMVGARAPLSR